MKRFGILAGLALGCCLGGYFAASAQQATPQPKERSVTITESQLEQIVAQRIAKRDKEQKADLDKRVLEGNNWHTAIFSGVEYTVYTGPGQVLATRWVEPTAPAAPTTPTAPATPTAPTSGTQPPSDTVTSPGQ